MQEISSGAGLAALGFWGFIAAVIAVGVWDNIRKREAQHETLRRIIESGAPVDAALTEKILSATSGSKDLNRDLNVGGTILAFIAPGLVLMGWLMSLVIYDRLFVIMLGVGAMVLFISAGLFAASYLVRRSHRRDLGTGST
jgi:hypothetical protein